MLTTLMLTVLVGTAPAATPTPTTADVRASIERNDLEEAGIALEAMLAKDPNNIEVMLALALLRMEQKSFSTAAELFTKVLALDPWDDDSRLNLVEAHWRSGAPEKAKLVLSNLLVRHPQLSAALSMKQQLDAGLPAPKSPSPWRPMLRVSLDIGFDSNYGYDSNFDDGSELGGSTDYLGIDSVFGKKSAVGTTELLAGVNHLGRSRPLTVYGRLKVQQSIGQFNTFRDIMPTLVGLHAVGRKSLGPVKSQLHLNYSELFTGLFDAHYHRLISAVQTGTVAIGQSNDLRVSAGVDFRQPNSRTSDTTARLALRDTQRLGRFTISAQTGLRVNYATESVSTDAMDFANHNTDYFEFGGALFGEYRFSKGLSAFALFDLSRRNFDASLTDTNFFAQSGLVLELGDFEVHGEYAYSQNSSSFDQRGYNRHQLNAGVRYWYN